MAADGQLIKQWLWDVVGGGGDDDGVERCLLRPTLVAIAHANSNVVIAQLGQGAFRLASQRFHDLMQDLFAGTQGYTDLKERLIRNLNGTLVEIAASLLLRRMVTSESQV